MEKAILTKEIAVGDILLASYTYSSKHNYFLLVTRRTPKTVDLVQLQTVNVTDDGYGQNGTETVAYDTAGQPIIDGREFKGKRVKVSSYDGSHYVKIMDYCGGAYHWDGKPESFYTD